MNERDGKGKTYGKRCPTFYSGRIPTLIVGSIDSSDKVTTVGKTDDDIQRRFYHFQQQHECLKILGGRIK